MTFEEVKELFKESIDSSDNINQAIENLMQSIYLKGYNDASKRIEYIMDKIKSEIEQLRVNTRINWNGCLPDIEYPEIEYVDVTKARLLEIIDKCKAESEDKK